MGRTCRVRCACVRSAHERAVEAHAQRVLRPGVEQDWLLARCVERHWRGAGDVPRVVSDPSDGCPRNCPADGIPWRGDRVVRADWRIQPAARAVDDVPARVAWALSSGAAAVEAAPDPVEILTGSI